MRKKYFVELYFYNDNAKKTGLSETPNLDEYTHQTEMMNVVSTNWEDAKKKILNKYPDVAYIYVHETRQIDI